MEEELDLGDLLKNAIEAEDVNQLIELCKLDGIELWSNLQPNGLPGMRGKQEELLPLHRAIQKNNVEMMKILIQAGSSGNSTSVGGDSPLGYAIRLGNGEAIDFLLSIDSIDTTVPICFVDPKSPFTYQSPFICQSPLLAAIRLQNTKSVQSIYHSRYFRSEWLPLDNDYAIWLSLMTNDYDLIVFLLRKGAISINNSSREDFEKLLRNIPNSEYFKWIETLVACSDTKLECRFKLMLNAASMTEVRHIMDGTLNKSSWLQEAIRKIRHRIYFAPSLTTALLPYI